MTVSDADILVGQFGWNQEFDLRIRSLSKLIHILIGLHLACCALLDMAHESDDYWSKHKLPRRESIDIKGHISNFDMFVKMGFVASLFSIAESTFRGYLIYIDAETYESIQWKTERIIRTLLLQKLERKYTYGLQMVDLIRNIRNSLHTNGVFSPPGGKPFSVVYRGKVYDFIPGKHIDFVSWDLLLDIADDFRSFFFQITTDAKTLSYKFIPDPAPLQTTYPPPKNAE